MDKNLSVSRATPTASFSSSVRGAEFGLAAAMPAAAPAPEKPKREGRKVEPTQAITRGGRPADEQRLDTYA